MGKKIGLGVDEKTLISLFGKWQPEEITYFRKTTHNFFVQDEHFFERSHENFLKRLKKDFLRFKVIFVPLNLKYVVKLLCCNYYHYYSFILFYFSIC